MRILEEFWYGNIEPTEYDTSSTAYKKLLELICRNEEKLRVNTPPETVPLDRTNGAARPLKWCMVTADMVH